MEPEWFPDKCEMPRRRDLPVPLLDAAGRALYLPCRRSSVRYYYCGLVVYPAEAIIKCYYDVTAEKIHGSFAVLHLLGQYMSVPFSLSLSFSPVQRDPISDPFSDI
jgi:hypothetical protein